jgi:5-methylcytosine-specific restriction endonuclease McrA
MPIREEMRGRYPKNWPEISRRTRLRAHDRCEWCGAHNKSHHPVTNARVVLTVAHLDHQPENCEPTNLRALCQKCHNGYDGPMRAEGKAKRRRALQERTQMTLFQRRGNGAIERVG